MKAADPILVTGLGAVTCAGPSAGTTWEAILSGRTGIGPIRQWDATGWPCRKAGEIHPFDPRALVPDRKLHKLLSRADLLGLNAAHQAVADAGLLAWRERLDEAERAEFNERTAVIAASGGGNYSNQYDFLPLLEQSDGDLQAFGAELTSMVSPMWLLRSLPNNVLCYVGIATGFKGHNANFTSHSTSGVLALLEAVRALREGEADRAVVVGHDCPVEPQAVLYFTSLGLLADSAIRPFDAARDGCLLGDGAAALVLETARSARERGAQARGEILGGAVAGEADGLLSLKPGGDGVKLAASTALSRLGLEPRDVGLVIAHGNGTPQSDASEGRALLELFGGDGPPVSAFKWAVGHLMAASGVLETVLGLFSLARSEAPPIATLDRLDPELAGLRVSPEPQPVTRPLALLLSRGFGGLAGALVLRGPQR